MEKVWQVNYSKKVVKRIKRLPISIQELVQLLDKELGMGGPNRGNWKNFSKLEPGRYHCHLKKGRPTYVACWEIVDKKSKVMEVYYVGTHEKAPY